MNKDLKVLDDIIKNENLVDNNNSIEQNNPENETNLKEKESLNQDENDGNAILNNNQELESITDKINSNYNPSEKEITENKSNENNKDNIDNLQTPQKEEKSHDDENLTNKILNLTGNNSSSSLNTESKKVISNNKKIEDDANISSNINSSTKTSKEISNETLSKKKDKSIKKIKPKKYIQTSRCKEKNAIRIKNNNFDKKLNNKTISESLYYEFNTLCINKNFIKDNKGNTETKRNIKQNNKNLQNDKFDNTYRRMIDGQKKKKEKIDLLKKNKEDKEKNLCYNKPKINKKSLELASKNKDDFYTRQKKLFEEKTKKEALLKEKFKKKEIEEINKNNILLTRNKEKNKKKQERRKSMDDVVKKIYKWDEKRKERLNDKIKSREKDIKLNLKAKPKINKNSYLITVHRNPNQIFNRLYIDDIIKRKENKELLEHIYTPSFRPNLVDSNYKNKKRNKYSSADKNSNIKTITYKTIGNYGEDKDENIYSENLGSDLDDFGSIHDDGEICDLIRAHVFRKQKNKKRYNTAENLHSNRIKSAKDNILNNNKNMEQSEDNLCPNFSPSSKRNDGKIKIKKNYGYLMAKNKNKNRSGYL